MNSNIERKEVICGVVKGFPAHVQSADDLGDVYVGSWIGARLLIHDAVGASMLPFPGYADFHFCVRWIVATVVCEFGTRDDRESFEGGSPSSRSRP